MISIISAFDENRLIGCDGGIPWHIPEDLRRFKALTIGKVVVMGRSTFESVGSEPLPGRTNFVLSKNAIPYVKKGCDESTKIMYATSLQDAIRLSADQDIFIIGGQGLYEEALLVANTAYLTQVKGRYFGKVCRYFPKMDPSQWVLIERQEHASPGCIFETYFKVKT